jgi:hypothetical protein
VSVIGSYGHCAIRQIPPRFFGAYRCALAASLIDSRRQGRI